MASTPGTEFADTPGARLRSGTAARLAGVPVATLRVWERRYGVVAAPKSTTGQRLYSGHDVQRLRLIRQLTEKGHAIGTIAMLSLGELAQRAEVQAAAPQAEDAGRRVVVGAHLVARVQRLPGGASMTSYDGLEAAEAAEAAEALPARLLAVHLASLQPASAQRLLALAARVQARSVVVVYGFAADAVVQQLRVAGAQVHRDPVDAGALWQLFGARRAALPTLAAPGTPTGPQPRHFSDAALAALATVPSSVACECPRHLAEIVLQLAGFERYSAECGSWSPADAVLHRQLVGVAGTARAQFEQVLLQVIEAEGITLPG